MSGESQPCLSTLVWLWGDLRHSQHGGGVACLLPSLGEQGRERETQGPDQMPMGWMLGSLRGTLALASLFIFLFIFLFVPNYLRQCPTLAKKCENS